MRFSTQLLLVSKKCFFVKLYSYFISGQEPCYRFQSSRFEVAINPSQNSPIHEHRFKRRVIQYNVSNSPISRIHVNTWEYKDHAKWMDEIHPGDEIVVHAVRPTGVINVVEFVRMDIYCAWQMIKNILFTFIVSIVWILICKVPYTSDKQHSITHLREFLS